MQTIPKIDFFYIDFMRVMPTLTHFIDKTTLKDHFTFLTQPTLFGSQYLLEVENPSARYFIHNLGALKTLPTWKWHYSFWRNIFVGPNLPNYIQSYLGEHFGYFPFLISSTATLSIKPDPKIESSTAKIMNNAKVALTLRFYPFGATVIHIMVFFQNEGADVKQFIEIQKALLNERFYNIQTSTSETLTLGLSEIFDDTQKKVYTALYNRPPNGAFEAKPGEIHRIIYFNSVDSEQITDDDAKLTSAALIGLYPVKNIKESHDLLANQVRNSKLKKDLIIFHPSATLLFAPNLNPRKEGFCLWNNSINVVEMATLQKFIIGKTNDLLNKALTAYPDFREFADNATLLQVIGRSFHSLRGSHRYLYNEIDKKLNLSLPTEQYFHMLESHRNFQVYEALKEQIQKTETLLTEIKEVASNFHFSQIGILMIDYLLDDTSDSINSLSYFTRKLREICARERQGSKLPNDSMDERNCKIAILTEITKYKKDLLNLEHLIEKIADHVEQKGVDVSLARLKLSEAKKIGIVDYTYDSTAAFMAGTKDYFEIITASAAALTKQNDY
ncbi:MAG: hypothetical protein CW716_08685 [Candidatus Bathyarchaeum sp.]|nr:MAG: hypothetical protein CW716_08685 [Candidatus Bathyarchaeum sp.]